MYKIIGANQVEYGPVTTEQLRQWIAEGRVNAQTMAQAAGETGWKPISSFPEFAASFPAASASLPPGGGSSTFNVSPDSGRALALDHVAGPAIALMVTGSLGIAYGLYALMQNLLGHAMATQADAFQRLQQQNPQAAKLMMMFSGTGGILVCMFMMVYCIFIVFCAVKMKKLESFGLAMTGTILAMLPCNCPCCCIGLPIGIWALIVLNKPEVKAHFN